MKNILISVTNGKAKLDLRPECVKSFEAKGAYTIVDTLDNKQYCKSINIGSIERQLKQTGLFIRTHETHLPGIACINWQERISNGTCAMIDGSRMPVARRKIKAFNNLRAEMNRR